MNTKVLIIGAGGQIGTELIVALNTKLGSEKVIISDIKEPSAFDSYENTYYQLDATDRAGLESIIIKETITEIYLLAAMLSATAEKFPMKGWDINMSSLMHVLELSVQYKIQRVFWPSSIAIFGASSPHQMTPQKTIVEPSTVYGISKYAGELWCDYFFQKYNLDVRSIRYPGLISWKTPPGGGTTDYAVDIYHQALKSGTYTCFLSADRTLPMMYMDDAIRATLQLMYADANNLTTRMSYNISAMSFSPTEITESIQKVIPNFQTIYEPDYRDQIASTWPQSINDDVAQKDWNWKAQIDLDQMTHIMLDNLSKED